MIRIISFEHVDPKRENCWSCEEFKNALIPKATINSEAAPIHIIKRNGTLIDEEFCKEMIRVKNFVPAISLEGFEGANDGRRGKGVFTKVQNAMKLLKKHNLPFGISTCYTSANYQDITSEAFFDIS